ncbi:MAG: hypothetical protein GY811_08960 [Myxococcales bacterium]|nr:hypothetical protein [Myxococcales bacterium]
MNPKMLTLLILGSNACADDPGIDLETARTGIYEAHTLVLEDTCTWDGLEADYPSASWQTGIFVDQLQGGINLPFAEQRGGIQRFDLLSEEDFVLSLVREEECGSETQEIQLVELTHKTAITQRKREWIVEEDCETEVDLLPDATCSTQIEQMMYLDESCDLPCEIVISTPNEPVCVCE